MNYARTDPRRRGLHQEFTALNLAYDWSTPNPFRAKTIRSVALSGLRDVNLYEIAMRKPVGVIELIGSRAGTVSTVMLVVFSNDEVGNIASFRIDRDYAVGTLSFPSSMFAGIVNLVSSTNVYFRICNDPECNAISTDASFSMVG